MSLKATKLHQKTVHIVTKIFGHNNTEEELYAAVEEFAYVQYNHVRPHSYNNYKTPYEARYGVA